MSFSSERSATIRFEPTLLAFEPSGVPSTPRRIINGFGHAPMLPLAAKHRHADAGNTLRGQADLRSCSL